MLAILALSVTVFAMARPGPSPAMQREARISAVIAASAEVRARAIIEGTRQIFDVAGPFCQDSPTTLTFFPSGTAIATRFCLADAAGDIWLQLDPLTAQLSRADTL